MQPYKGSELWLDASYLGSRLVEARGMRMRYHDFDVAGSTCGRAKKCKRRRNRNSEERPSRKKKRVENDAKD